MSNAPDADSQPRRFQVTHPFHPLFGREFELVEYHQCWGEDRVFYVDEAERMRSLPAHWTSAVADDPLVVIAAGQSMWRVNDLLELVILMQGIER